MRRGKKRWGEERMVGVEEEVLPRSTILPQHNPVLGRGVVGVVGVLRVVGVLVLGVLGLGQGGVGGVEGLVPLVGVPARLGHLRHRPGVVVRLMLNLIKLMAR